jgi:hypothetical protein
VLWLAEIAKFLFSETNVLTEPKLYMNDHWKVLYQITVFFYKREGYFYIFPYSTVLKVCPAVVAILDFLST